VAGPLRKNFILAASLSENDTRHRHVTNYGRTSITENDKLLLLSLYAKPRSTKEELIAAVMAIVESDF